MKKETTTIYGVKNNDKFYYIGKTNKNIKINEDSNNLNNLKDITTNNTDDNLIKNFYISSSYKNRKLKQVISNNENINVVLIKTVDSEDWYDEKLQEVVKKYSEDNPLVNAQWMLDGKRGFWEDTQGFWQDKKRDPHTLQRLSESKYKKYCQYDKYGSLLKIWNSGKEIGEQIFNDYKVINGGGDTKFYTILQNKKLKGRFRFNSYWFTEKEMLDNFTIIPSKLNLGLLYAKEKEKYRKFRYKEPLCKICGETDETNFYANNKSTCKKCYGISKNNVNRKQKRYSVNHFNLDGTLKQTYKNTSEAAYILKTDSITINRFCRGTYSQENYPDYILKYGEKILQEECSYPKDYVKVVPKRLRREKKIRTRTRTRYSVVLYNNEGKEIQKFLNTKDAARILKINEATVRNICKGILPKTLLIKLLGNYTLKYGEKYTVDIEN